MGNESSSSKRQASDGGQTSRPGNGARPLSAHIEDTGGKQSKSSSFRRRTKSDATAKSPSPQSAPPTQAPPPAAQEEVNVSIKIYRSMNNLDSSNSKKAPTESLHDKVVNILLTLVCYTDTSPLLVALASF